MPEPYECFDTATIDLLDPGDIVDRTVAGEVPVERDRRGAMVALE
ncbi:hypothetical protein [Kocuria atrinae]